MKKQRKRQSSNGKTARKKTVVNQGPNRRDFIGMAKITAIGAPILIGASFFGVRSVQASMAEADLSRIGTGLPTIVQIHDPQCSACQVLQKQTRRALKELPDDSYTYLVADIKTTAGLAFAARYGVGHVTLLFFDGAGEPVETLRGPAASDHVTRAVQNHIRG